MINAIPLQLVSALQLNNHVPCPSFHEKGRSSPSDFLATSTRVAPSHRLGERPSCLTNPGVGQAVISGYEDHTAWLCQGGELQMYLA